MTVSPAPTRSRHRHSKSSSSIQTVTLSVAPFKAPPPRFQPPTHQNQSSPSHRNNSNSPPISRVENGSSKKKRRSRKPKENIKVSPTRLNASLSDSAIPRTTSPISPEQMTPTKPTASPGKAYAGPTFHHSPAPSTLPVPKFFSKSVPTRSRNEGLQAMLEEDDVRTDEPLESPVLNGSPLEKLFRADRKEKALKNRQFSDSSDCDSTSDSIGRDIFGMDTDSPIRAVFNTPRRTHVRNNTGTESIFSMDSFNIPSPPPPMSPFNDDPDRRAKSDALKKFLLNDSGVFSPSPAPRAPAMVAQSQTMPNIQGSPVPQRHQGRRSNSLSTPPPKDSQYCTNHNRPPIIKNFSPQLASIFDTRTDTVPCKADSDDFTDMENSLRKILKLDPRPVSTGGVFI